VSPQFKTEQLPNFLRCQFFGFSEIKGGDRSTADTRELFSKKPWLLQCQVLLMTLKKSAFTFYMNVCIYWTGRKFPFWYFLTAFLHETSSLGAFAKFWKATIIIVMSVRPYGTTQLLLDGFKWNFIFVYFSKIRRENLSSIKIVQDKGHFTWCPIYYIFYHI